MGNPFMLYRNNLVSNYAPESICKTLYHQLYFNVIGNFPSFNASTNLAKLLELKTDNFVSGLI